MYFLFQVIPQLKFNYDLIEVSNGKSFKLSSRVFVNTPFKRSDIGIVSPRCFHSYDTRNMTFDGGYFESSVINSFPDVPIRAEFLNKFYQCLLYGQLPHKAKKLVACGASNSGKSSWARLFFGLFGKNKVASVTKEKSFGLSMVEEDTEIIFIDEWSENTMDVDNVKSFFQGGWMVQSRKHQNARTIINNAGNYEI